MIEDIEKRISQLQQLDVNNLLNEILTSLQDEIIKFNTLDQLFDKGLTTDSKELPAYRPFTVKIKSAKGQRVDHMTLKDTGDFYAAWFVKMGKDSITLGSADGKAIELDTRYPGGIFGLTDDSLEKLRNFVKPLLIERLRQHFDG